jgi:hypothetical protein
MAERQPFKAVLEHDYNTLFGVGKQALFELFVGGAGQASHRFESVAPGLHSTNEMSVLSA